MQADGVAPPLTPRSPAGRGQRPDPAAGPDGGQRTGRGDTNGPALPLGSPPQRPQRESWGKFGRADPRPGRSPGPARSPLSPSPLLSVGLFRCLFRFFS